MTGFSYKFCETNVIVQQPAVHGLYYTLQLHNYLLIDIFSDNNTKMMAYGN